jgi:four helix bundle protein
MMIESYLDLIVWQKAMDLVVEVYRLTQRFPKDELYGLVSQMRRAAVSVPSNIAEGQGRRTRGEFLQFLGQARGSLAELNTQAILALRISLLPAPEAKALELQIVEVGRLLSGLQNSLTADRQPARPTSNRPPTNH